VAERSQPGRRPFAQVDVFGETACSGNPLAVVLDASGLSTEEMQRFARWTNLSETTFVLPPTEPGADYAVRIFMIEGELPFAGHPTLGTCHAWLEHRRASAGGGGGDGVIVQQCGLGLVTIRQRQGRLAFEAPPLLRSGAVDEELLGRLAAQLGIGRGDIVDASWADNGPGWVALLLADAHSVLALRPERVDTMIGVAGPFPPGSPESIEVRAFCPMPGGVMEDPVTGSLNASIAQWLLASGRLQAPYTARQGSALGRSGRVEISIEDGAVFVGGRTTTVVTGTVEL
jgi:PhzF family phenazine biosynthesis protein